MDERMIRAALRVLAKELNLVRNEFLPPLTAEQLMDNIQREIRDEIEEEQFNAEGD